MRKFSPRTRVGYPSSEKSPIKNWLPGGNPLVYKDEVLADLPWAYWRLGETSGTTAVDISGNARNATYTNSPTLGTNPLITVDNSVDLDGTNDYVSFTPGAAVTGNFTYECWINADSFSGFPGLVSAWNANSSGNYGSILLVSDTGVVEIYAANSTFTDWSYTDNTGYTLSTGTTYHLVFVNDDTNNAAKLYVNGVEQYSASGKTTAMGMINASKILSIGRATTSNYFNGRMDEVAIYTTALSADRILAHYKAGVNGVNPFVESLAIEYLAIAGGGGGGSDSGGGGGAGGYLTSTISLNYSTNYSVTIGAGGNGGLFPTDGTNGSNSIFASVTSTGGGKGATETFGNGGNGGSGGGGSAGPGLITGGTGTSGQGNNGGDGSGVNPSTYGRGGGGGGAGAVGLAPASGNAGNGGNGLSSSITGSAVTRAGGGGGGSLNTGSGGTGGTGGGGAGGGTSNNIGQPGTVNTGGGGGGASNDTGGAREAGGNGGSGVVILRWLTSDATITVGAGLTSSSTTDGLYSVTTITAGTGNVSWS